MATTAEATTLPWVDQIAASFPFWSFVEFHRHELPRLIEKHGAHVVGDVRTAPSLGFRLADGTAFTVEALGAGPAGSLDGT